MEYQVLAKTGFKVSKLGFGLSSLGGFSERLASPKRLAPFTWLLISELTFY
jgi:aryl-alcohol dehydrogenase-like predicted oxidoreductase